MVYIYWIWNKSIKLSWWLKFFDFREITLQCSSMVLWEPVKLFSFRKDLIYGVNKSPLVAILSIWLLSYNVSIGVTECIDSMCALSLGCINDFMNYIY